MSILSTKRQKEMHENAVGLKDIWSVNWGILGINELN